MAKNILAALAALVGYVALAFATMAFIPWGERLALMLVAGLLGVFSRTWSWARVLLFALLAAGLEIFGIYLATRDPLRQAGAHGMFIMNEFGRKSVSTLLIVMLIAVVAAGVGYWLGNHKGSDHPSPPPAAP